MSVLERFLGKGAEQFVRVAVWVIVIAIVIYIITNIGDIIAKKKTWKDISYPIIIGLVVAGVLTYLVGGFPKLIPQVSKVADRVTNTAVQAVSEVGQ